MPELLLTNKTRRLRVLLAVLTIGVVCAMTGCSSDDNSAPGDEPTTTSVVAASTTPPPLTAATTSETVEGSNSVGGGTDASTPGVPAGGAARPGPRSRPARLPLRPLVRLPSRPSAPIRSIMWVTLVRMRRSTASESRWVHARRRSRPMPSSPPRNAPTRSTTALTLVPTPRSTSSGNKPGSAPSRYAPSDFKT